MPQRIKIEPLVVTKNNKSMYCSCDIERLFIRYKAEVMPQKSMIQGYKTSNRTSTTKYNRNQKPVL